MVCIFQLSTPLGDSCREGSETLSNSTRSGDEVPCAIAHNWVKSEWKHAKLPTNPQPSSQPPAYHTGALIVALLDSDAGGTVAPAAALKKNALQNRNTTHDGCLEHVETWGNMGSEMRDEKQMLMLKRCCDILRLTPDSSSARMADS